MLMPPPARSWSGGRSTRRTRAGPFHGPCQASRRSRRTRSSLTPVVVTHSAIDVQLQNALREWQRFDGPLYVQLTAALRAAIEAGELPAGRKLPPERVLAAYLAVGRRTVARAYEALSDRALVDRRQGAGTRVTGPLVRLDDDRAAKRTTSLQRNIVFGSLSQSSEPVIDLLAVYAPGGTAITAEALRAAADSLERLAGAHHGYSPAGFQPLRAAIAARYS